MNFKGKVALVTGAGSGIGEATARRLAADGARVAVLDILADRAEAVASAITAQGGDAFALVADAADPEAMRAAFAQLTETAGRLDLIVANAGINGYWAPIDLITPEEWERTVRTNLNATYLALHLGVPMLKAVGGGAVVIVASVNGNRIASTAGATAYSAAKAGQAAMARQLGLELAKHRIRVNAMLPGWIDTKIGENTWRRETEQAAAQPKDGPSLVPLTGERQPAPPAVIADAIAMLLSDDARHVTGTELVVDGAQTLLR